MSGSREQVLKLIRSALADVPRDESRDAVPVARDYRRADERPREALVAEFAERVSDYHAEVRRVAASEVAAAVYAVCSEQRLRRIAVPTGLPDAWRPDGVELVEDRGLPAAELDRIDGALTGCAVAIAQTGTLVLDGHGASGRRLITLVPDHHICVVGAEQVVGLVPEAIAALGRAVSERRVPVTFVSGPSASSDIELSRVEGVHGPRHLVVLIAG